MGASRTFFVPAAKAENPEQVYAELARRCNREVPKLVKRISSIIYNHDGTIWTATVGKSLQGVRRVASRLKGVED